MAALATLATGKPASCEAISITNFSLTGTSVTFHISGTFPGTTVPPRPQGLFFANPNIMASPGFALGDPIRSSSYSFTGSQALSSSVYFPVSTGNPDYGDYFYVAFENDFSIGEAISGTLNANWSSTAFDPSQVTSLDVFWGAGSSPPIGISNGSILLTTVAVPEIDPAGMGSVLALIGGGLGLLERLRKRA
jgi:hypothetical protein